MKTIGFVDYYISEWHANKYPEWIREASEILGEKFEVKYAWAEEYVSPVDGRNTDEWCEAYGVERCKTISEVCEKSDYILVLAPSNPEKHLGYAKAVLKYRKNTYIDKTFSPDYAIAKEIFAIAEEYGTKFFSTSALRYGFELQGLKNARALVTFGAGSNIEEYIVHQVEMAVNILNAKAEKVRVEKQNNQYICRVLFQEDKAATMIFAGGLSFAVCGNNVDGQSAYESVSLDFFKTLVKEILRFYLTGVVPFDSRQTLEVMKIREGIIKGTQRLGEWLVL